MTSDQRELIKIYVYLICWLLYVLTIFYQTFSASSPRIRLQEKNSKKVVTEIGTIGDSRNQRKENSKLSDCRRLLISEFNKDIGYKDGISKNSSLKRSFCLYRTEDSGLESRIKLAESKTGGSALQDTFSEWSQAEDEKISISPLKIHRCADTPKCQCHFKKHKKVRLCSTIANLDGKNKPSEGSDLQSYNSLILSPDISPVYAEQITMPKQTFNSHSSKQELCNLQHDISFPAKCPLKSQNYNEYPIANVAEKNKNFNCNSLELASYFWDEVPSSSTPESQVRRSSLPPPLPLLYPLVDLSPRDVANKILRRKENYVLDATIEQATKCILNRGNTGSVLSSGKCVICLEAAADTVLLRCNHLCMCYCCAEKQWLGPGTGNCPVCRNNIQMLLRPQ